MGRGEKRQLFVTLDLSYKQGGGEKRARTQYRVNEMERKYNYNPQHDDQMTSIARLTCPRVSALLYMHMHTSTFAEDRVRVCIMYVHTVNLQSHMPTMKMP